MKIQTNKIFSTILSLGILIQMFVPLVGGQVWAGATTLPATARFSEQELDELLGPIALYPDPLLAQVIPAATFVDQVIQAQQTLKGNVNETVIEKQAWDVSVKSVAHYPQVLEMMAAQPDWTTAVGQAYVYQSTDVMKSVQRLRALAKNSGALESTPQQTVTVEKEYITIVPAQPGVIYVPTYNPQVVYVSSGPPPGSAAIAFGVGLAIGAWLNRDWHWYGPGIYYHGWAGVGWIGVNRTYVHVNNVYVNRSFTHVNVNRTVVNRNITTFRTDLNRRAVNGNHLDINRGVSGKDYRRPSTMPARTGTARRHSTNTGPANRHIKSPTNNGAFRKNNSNIGKNSMSKTQGNRSAYNPAQRNVKRTGGNSGAARRKH